MFIEVRTGHSVSVAAILEFEDYSAGKTKIYTANSKFTVDMSYDSFKKLVASHSSSMERDLRTLAKSAQFVSV